jgi:hypothetical protein
MKANLLSFTISLSVLLGMRNISDKSCRIIQNTLLCSITPFLENFAFYEIMSNNFVHPDWSQTM